MNPRAVVEEKLAAEYDPIDLGLEAVFQEGVASIQRVVAELKTTFVSHYTKETSLAEARRVEEIGLYGRRATGAKYLINPNKGIAL